jgi:hypothetical protein
VDEAGAFTIKWGKKYECPLNPPVVFAAQRDPIF